MAQKGLSAEILDLRTVAPFDTDALLVSVSKTGRLLAADEDYRELGLSGELAARILESGLQADFSRIGTEGTIPYSRELEDRTLPATDRIVDAALNLINA